MTRVPLERIADRFVDPEPTEFFDELWHRAEMADRAAARRWRRVAIAVVAASLAAAASVGVLAATRSTGVSAAAHTVDATFLCTADDQGGVNLFKLDVDVLKGSGLFLVSSTNVEILAPFELPQQAGTKATPAQLLDGKLNFEPANCARATPRKIPLERRELPLKGRLAGYSPVANCWVAKAYFRERVTFDSKNRATRTIFAMANAHTGKPLVFGEAGAARATVYAASACRHD
jgi:hypothetical protein